MKNPYRELSKVSPQKENGDRRVANDIWEALMKAGLSGAEYQIIFLVIGNTWGFQKTCDGITFSQMEKRTKLSRRTVINAVKELEKKRILVVDRQKESGKLPRNSYLFNKHYDTWLKKTGEKMFTSLEVEQMRKFCKVVKKNTPVKQKLVKNSAPEVVKKSSPEVVKNSAPTKDIYKDNNKEYINNTTKSAIPDTEYCKLSPQEKKRSLDLLVRLHFKKFPYSKSPDRKIHGKKGYTAFVARTRDYFEGLFEKYPTLSPKKIEIVIAEAKDSKPWKYYPEERARKEQYNQITKDEERLLEQAKKELEVCSSEDKIYNWLKLLPPNLHGALAAHLNRVYPDGHSYDKAKIRWKKEQEHG